MNKCLIMVFVFLVVFPMGCSRNTKDTTSMPQVTRSEQPIESNVINAKPSIIESTKPKVNKPETKPVEENISLEYTDVDNKILALIVKAEVEEGKFIVVKPEARIGHLSWPDKRKERLRWWCGFHNQDKKLVESFFEKNENDTQLNLKSSNNNGFIVDYDKKFENYFEESISRDSWDKLYEENPTFQYFLYLSLPAYDKSTGIVIIYQAYMKNCLWGAGYFKMYKYSEGKIKELHSMNLWIS